MVKAAEEVRIRLKEEGFGDCSVVNARFVKPIDEEALLDAAENHTLIVTMEENVLSGGYSQKVMDYVFQNQLDVRVLPITLPDEYVEHGNVELLKKEVGMDAETITGAIRAAMAKDF